MSWREEKVHMSYAPGWTLCGRQRPSVGESRRDEVTCQQCLVMLSRRGVRKWRPAEEVIAELSDYLLAPFGAGRVLYAQSAPPRRRVDDGPRVRR